MTAADVKRVFAKYVSGEALNIGDGQSVDVSFFADVLFSTAPATPTRLALDAIDGGTRGYGPFFKRCQAEGLIV